MLNISFELGYWNSHSIALHVKSSKNSSIIEFIITSIYFCLIKPVI